MIIEFIIFFIISFLISIIFWEVIFYPILNKLTHRKIK